MGAAKRQRLEAAGHAVGTADEFLALTEAESELLDIKLALRRALRERREALGLTQGELAERIGSSQSRVAKVEAETGPASLDAIVRALLATGLHAKGIAHLLNGKLASAGLRFG